MVLVNAGGYDCRSVYIKSGVNFLEENKRDFIDEFDYLDQSDEIVQNIITKLKEKKLIWEAPDKVGIYLVPIIVRSFNIGQNANSGLKILDMKT